ncbi:hypothetical protein ACHAW5_001920 [Stephanodiscus triporus]|uniref:SDE2/SF3A3 SAP domain-containing protein n=1 Tax=Stephanodiscus triporus TaxID=2934178 RepID=A0ABD3QTG3_9STRA
MKGRRIVERQLENEARGWKAREDRAIYERERRRTERERAVTDYVRRGEEEGSRRIIVAGESAKEGMLAHYRKRRERARGDCADAGGTTTAVVANDDKRSAPSADGEAAAGAHYLMTLSGEMSAFDLPLDDGDDAAATTTKLRIVSQSDFATAVVLLSLDKTRDMRGRGAYVEYTLRTAGLAQIGWARVGVEGEASGGGGDYDGGAFLPNSDTGDDVGDDCASYGYDGSRGLVFHGGEELAYGSESPRGGEASVEWRPGTFWAPEEEENAGNGTVKIGYSMIGKDLGRAFAVSNADGAFRFYPAISLNLNEVVDVNIGPDFAYFDPRGGCASVYELVGNKADVTGDGAGDGNDEEGDSSKQTYDEKDPPTKRPRDESLKGQSAANEIKDAAKEGKDVKPSKPIANFNSFDLNKCCSVDELKVLGPERLKDIMLSMGVKCGGTLDERATRLFSLKGLRRDEYPKKVRGKKFIP